MSGLAKHGVLPDKNKEKWETTDFLGTTMPSEYREPINVLVSVTSTTDQLVEIVRRKDEIIAALTKLSELPLPVLERLADPNCG